MAKTTSDFTKNLKKKKKKCNKVSLYFNCHVYENIVQIYFYDSSYLMSIGDKKYFEKSFMINS